MKCKFCGYDISETDTKCPGCDKDVTELKDAGNVIYSEEPSDISDTPVEDEIKEEVVSKDESVSESNVEESTTQTVEPVVIKDKFKKKNGFKIFVIIFFLLLIVAAGGFGYMYFIYTSPVKVTKKMYNDLLANLPTDKASTLNVDYTNSKLMGYNINAKHYLSNDDVISNVSVTGNEVMLNINAVKNSDGIYLYESNIYDKYVKLNDDTDTPDDFVMLNVLLHKNELVNILKNINLDTYISSNELTKEFTTITHDQKNMGATKFSYSNNKANGVISKFLISIRDNKNNLESLSKLLNKSSEDTVTEINNIITSINTNNYKIGFDLYTDYLTKSYYKLDITIKSNDHNITVNIEFKDNKIKDIKVTLDETYIYITNNMSNINVTEGDVNTTFTCKYTNDKLPYPVLDDVVLYDDVSAVIDTNISNNDAIRRLKDAFNGEVILDADVDILPEDSDATIDQNASELSSLEETTNNVNE